MSAATSAPCRAARRSWRRWRSHWPSPIFLDEGFGTLDGETLDVLASAIEELSASGRLVAIVTHVRDLAERMPVRFEVRKGSTTSTIERSEG
jgi:exonuclease SbcC